MTENMKIDMSAKFGDCWIDMVGTIIKVRISASLSMKISLQIPAMTSLPSTLTVKKSMKMTFSSDKIYYNLQIFKISIDVIRTLNI